MPMAERAAAKPTYITEQTLMAREITMKLDTAYKRGAGVGVGTKQKE